MFQVIICLIVNFAVLPFLLIAGCYYSKIQKRDALHLESNRRIEVIPLDPAPEAIVEAQTRHDMQKWYPKKLELQNESIHDENYKSAHSRLKLQPHPKTENLPMFAPLDPNRK